MSLLTEGTKAPDFTLPLAPDRKIPLADHAAFARDRKIRCSRTSLSNP
jgi:hypothetical protein